MAPEDDKKGMVAQGAKVLKQGSLNVIETLLGKTNEKVDSLQRDMAQIREIVIGIHESIENMSKRMDERFDAADEDRKSMRSDMNSRFNEAQSERASVREDMNARFSEARSERHQVREDMNTRFSEAQSERKDLQSDIKDIKGTLGRLEGKLDSFKNG